METEKKRMNTKDFKVQTFIMNRNNGVLDKYWEIALDVGYSGVKVFAPNKVILFPFFAQRLRPGEDFISAVPKQTIIYRDDETGEKWLVGEIAQNSIDGKDTSVSDTALYTRDRYTSDMFKVVAKCAIGIALLKNKYGDPEGKKIIVQTGLPERYLKSDTDILKNVLAMKCSYSIKIGNSDWLKINLDLSTDDIFVMSQPMGTLFSVCFDENGQFITDRTNDLFHSDVAVFDPGFGTLDIFVLKHGIPQKGETSDKLGMKQILENTCDILYEKYKIDIAVPYLQKCLDKGVVLDFDRLENKMKEYDFSDALEESCERVAKDALKLFESRSDLNTFKYFIVTGGTINAWLPYIEEAFKNTLNSIQVIYGNENDNLGFTFSNVRGYYLFRFNKLAETKR